MKVACVKNIVQTSYKINIKIAKCFLHPLQRKYPMAVQMHRIHNFYLLSLPLILELALT
jgi:hypothetical protein